MCGIAGWAGPLDADGETLRRMCDVLGHRGPDDDGALLEPGRLGLGFRRLSIIDLTTGHQPIASEDGSVVVTCNGEIYNFRALRTDLEGRGHVFRTGSDVETIVHLYEEHGLRFVDHLRGMFAIALWDARRKRLVLVRDRLGVKPLYWARVGPAVLYGSEPGAILGSGHVAPRPDLQAIADYLALQYVPPPRTGFEGIAKLAPGEMLVHEGGQATVSRWWELSYSDKDRRPDAELLDELDALLDEATRLRLIADVPVGAFLSGGIDSSLVTAYMARNSSQVRTFSIDFPHAGYSEAAHARRVSEVYGTMHEERLLEPDMVPVIAETVRHAGEPFADVSAIPTYLLSQVTRRHVTVALSGDGGDEAFAGYPRYQLAMTGDRLQPVGRLLRPLNNGLERWRPANGHAGYARRAIRALARSSDERYAAWMLHFTPAEVRELARPEFLRATECPAPWEDQLALPVDAVGVDRYLALDTRTYLPGDLLVKVDRMSMAHSLEVRSPLLDQHVHTLAAAMPQDMKLRRGVSKWALKQLARRHGLPEELVERPKQGFGVPIGEWMRDELRGWVTGVLTDERTRARGYFEPHAVDRLLNEHVTGEVDHRNRLWNLTMLELWHRAWIDAPVAA